MNKEEFKSVLVSYIDGMIDRWFDSGSINDIVCKAAAKTVVKSNKDKYDNYLDYICDANGSVCINDFLDNILDEFQGYLIDLTEFNIPFLPNKILLISKEDIVNLKKLIIKL